VSGGVVVARAFRFQVQVRRPRAPAIPQNGDRLGLSTGFPGMRK
jgi:hypothetical protein